MDVNFTLTSVNVRGIRDATKRARVFEWCKEKKSNIVFLQETYSTEDIEEKWKSEWGGQGVFSHGTNHSKGVAVMFGEDRDRIFLNRQTGDIHFYQRTNSG